MCQCLNRFEMNKKRAAFASVMPACLVRIRTSGASFRIRKRSCDSKNCETAHYRLTLSLLPRLRGMKPRKCLSKSLKALRSWVTSIASFILPGPIYRSNHWRWVLRSAWALGAHRDNTRLCVHFDTIADRDRFEQIAKELGWSSKVLGVRLLTDFMEKFPTEKRNRLGNSELHD